MPIVTFDGKTPRIHPSAWVSQMAFISGDVVLGENCNVWPGASIRGDFGPISFGKNCSIQDGASVHTSEGLEIGDNVLIGHGAVIHGKKIGNNCLIGINATVLDNAEIGEFCIIAAGALVAANMRVPSGSMVMGIPAQVKGPVMPQQRKYLETVGSAYTALARRYKEQGL